MQFVEPIRNVKHIIRIKEKLFESSKRNYLLFMLGINTGLRISDLLKLRVSDVRKKRYLTVREKKTKKHRKIYLSPLMKRTINLCIWGKGSHEYLFASRKGVKPISRVQAYRILRNVCKSVRLKCSVGTHTLRKTFGYHFYRQTKDVALLQNILNHSNPHVTLRYIGVTQDLIDQSLKEFTL